MATRKRVGLREVRNLQPNQIVWDVAVPGFGARRQRGDAVSYVLFYRNREGRQRWFTIGRHGAPWTPDTAREEAKRLLGEVAHKADPAAEKRSRRNAKTVAELCDLYLADAKAGRLLTRRVQKKPSTLAIDAGRIERHIKPLLGRRTVSEVTRDDVEAFMQDVAAGKTAAKVKSGNKRGLARVRGGRGAANRAVGLLGAIFTYAVRARLRSDNPAHGVMRPPDGKRDRRLTEDEYLRLGRALKAASVTEIWPAAITAARFLILTGWRSGEALSLRWDDIDLPRKTAKLRDTKTGVSCRPLSRAACDVLLAAEDQSNVLVFRATRGGADVVLSSFKKLFKKILKLAELPEDITPHTLRHSFISVAADLGLSEPTIAALVGHKGRSVTSRYIHSADAVLLAAADVVANQILGLMGQRDDITNVLDFRRPVSH
jgi:integrase